MLVFKNIAFLWLLLPLLAIPLIIHLLNRKFPKTIPFSHIEYIRKSITQRSRLLRMRHIILVILRTLVILALLLAFLNPFLDLFRSHEITKTEQYVIIVLDHSLSMEYKGGVLSPRKKALIEIDKIIKNLADDVKLNIVIAENQAMLCLPDFTTNHEHIFSYINDLPIAMTKANIDQATMLAAGQFTQIIGAKDIYYISDFQRKNWSNVDLNKLPEDIRVFFVDVSSPIKNNRAILQARVMSYPVLAGQDIPIEVTIGNFSDEPLEDRLELLVDNSSVFYRDFSVEPWSVKRVTANILTNSPGIHKCKIAISKDYLEYDNDYFLTIKTLDQEQVIIMNDANQQTNEGVFYIKTAINPFVKTQGPFGLKLVNSHEITSIDLADCSKLILTGIHRLSPDKCDLLTDFVHRGGGLIYFLDGLFDSENVAQLDFSLKNVLPLRLTVKQQAQNIPGGMQKIWKGDFRSKFVELFAKQLRSALAKMEFYQYYYTIPTGKERILLYYADGSPAMASCNSQLGTIVLCNFSVGELASNLARQEVFPVWMQHILKNLHATPQLAESYLIDQVFYNEVWKSDLQGNHFISPKGNKLKPEVKEISNERVTIHFTGKEQGIYFLQNQNKLVYAYAFNCDPDESDLRKMDLQSLTTRTDRQLYSMMDEYEFVRQGKPIFYYFIVAALLLLVMEAVLFKVFKELSR